MSLIHDALRKAAEETDRQGRRGRPASWRDVGPVPPPRRRPVWPWATAGFAMVLGLAGLVAFFARSPEPAAVATQAAAPVAPAPAAPAPTPQEKAPPPSEPVEPAVEKVSLARVEALAPEPVAPLPANPAPPAPPQPAPPPAAQAPPPAAGAPSAPPAAAEPGPAQAAPKMIAPPAQIGQVGDDTYVLEAVVDGKELRLDFIVWSEQPFAQINGRQVGIGQQVEGFLVTAITRERVTLETPTRRLMLKVR
jgi:hypothetical protein